MTESASFNINAVQTSATSYNYTLTLADTGTTPLGTFWFSWVPGAGFLPNLPSFSAPAGWTGTLTDGAPPANGYSIQWVANSAGSALQAGQSLAFTFTSATAPSVLLGASSIHPPTPADTAFLYSGTPFSDAGISVTSDQAIAHLRGGVTDFYVDGALTQQRTIDADGGFDVHRFGMPGTFEGVAYASFDNAFDATGARVSKTFFDSANNVLATVTFTGDGGYVVHVGGVLTREKTVDADGASDVSTFDVQGEPFSSRQTHWSPSGVLLANSFDLNGGGGKLNLFGADLTANATTGVIDLGSAADFAFTPHATELYSFFTGATEDTVTFTHGFGAATIRGFASASTSDVLNITSLFSTFQDAKNAMTPSGDNTIITDHSLDTLTLVGVGASTLTAARLGF